MDGLFHSNPISVKIMQFENVFLSKTEKKYAIIKIPYNPKCKSLIKYSISYGCINASLYTY